MLALRKTFSAVSIVDSNYPVMLVVNLVLIYEFVNTSFCF